METKDKNNGKHSAIAYGEVEIDGTLLFIREAAVEVPTTAAALRNLNKARWLEKIAFYMERGAQLEVDTEASFALEAFQRQLKAFGDQFQNKVKSEFIEQLRALLTESDARTRLYFGKLIDPDSKTSVPAATAIATAKAVEAVNAQATKRLEELLSDGEKGILSRYFSELEKKLGESTVTIVGEIAAKRALTTKSTLAGRPWEDMLEAALTARASYSGDIVERLTNTVGQAQRLTGDFVITVNPADIGTGTPIKVLVESKRRNKPFSVREIRDELALGIKNRGETYTGLLVVQSAEMLPGKQPFVDISPNMFAVAYDEETGDHTALTMGIRIARLFAISAARKQGGDKVDVDKAMRLLAEIRSAVAYREQLRKAHVGAANNVANAAELADKMTAAVLEAVSKLEDVLTA